MNKASREAKVAPARRAGPGVRGGPGAVRAAHSRSSGGPRLPHDLLAFQPRIALIGTVNGLAQTLLKLTAPGVPDTYQGCELWDLSLVDPDNRRPVDFELRRTFLEQGADPGALLASWHDGRIKRHVVARTLALRRRDPELFETGSYEPLEGAGALADRLVAFGRRTEREMIVVAVPRLIAGLFQIRSCRAPPEQYGMTRALSCPRHSPAESW